MAYRDGFYVNGLPLAKAYRELPESVRGRGGGAFANCYPRGGTANAEMELRTDAGPALNRIFLRARKRHAVQPAGR